MQEILDGAFEIWVHGERPFNSDRWPENVARLMREGSPPVDMLIDGWLVAEQLHWFLSDAEAGKTWLALRLGLSVMNAGRIPYAPLHRSPCSAGAFPRLPLAAETRIALPRPTTDRADLC
jgi:hypothetical protein